MHHHTLIMVLVFPSCNILNSLVPSRMGELPFPKVDTFGHMELVITCKFCSFDWGASLIFVRG